MDEQNIWDELAEHIAGEFPDKGPVVTIRVVVHNDHSRSVMEYFSIRNYDQKLLKIFEAEFPDFADLGEDDHMYETHIQANAMDVNAFKDDGTAQRKITDFFGASAAKNKH